MTASFFGATLIAYGRLGTESWRHDVGGPIRNLVVEDLNDDGRDEVIAGIASGKDSGINHLEALRELANMMMPGNRVKPGGLVR